MQYQEVEILCLCLNLSTHQTLLGFGSLVTIFRLFALCQIHFRILVFLFIIQFFIFFFFRTKKIFNPININMKILNLQNSLLKNFSFSFFYLIFLVIFDFFYLIRTISKNHFLILCLTRINRCNL
jgi:hypothetical protein